MAVNRFPQLDAKALAPTRDALHAYCQILGMWLKHLAPQRKHWWHASLRPSLNGLTTGVIQASIDIELELNLRESLIVVSTAQGQTFSERLSGQSVNQLADQIEDFLLRQGLLQSDVPTRPDSMADIVFEHFSSQQAKLIADALASVSKAMTPLRAEIREETSPIQLWPHHFDLSMLWLPGSKIPGQDVNNAENADKQLNFGFTLGDESIPEPYFYITAYPLPENLPSHPLPKGTVWQGQGFNGAVLLYADLIKQSEPPETYLNKLWHSVLSAARDTI